MVSRAQGRKRFSDAIVDASDAPTNFDDIGLALMLLPHRQPPNDGAFAGHYLGGKWHFLPSQSLVYGSQERVGVPYGAVSRVVAFHLLEKAVSKRSPWVEFGEGWVDWFSRCGFSSQSQRCVRRVEEQTIRMVSAHLTTTFEDERSASFWHIPFVNGYSGGRLGYPWKAKVKLHETLFERLMKEPAPVQRRALQKLMPSSQAMQIYIWLAYCLRNLKRPVLLPWGSLFAQFDGGHADKVTWHRYFLLNLEAVKLVYGVAKLEATERGLKLLPSPSPIDRARGLQLISYRHIPESREVAP